MQNISVNKVLLIGVVDGVPDLRYTQTNRAVLNMRVVTSETYVNREGQTIESKSSHTVAVWGQKGENLKNQLHPNSRVMIEGRIRNRSYEDNTGQKKWVTEIDAQTAIALDVSTQQASPPVSAQPQQTHHPSVPPQQPAPPPQQPPQSAPPQYQPPQQPAPAPEAPPSPVTPEDDLPF